MYYGRYIYLDGYDHVLGKIGYLQKVINLEQEILLCVQPGREAAVGHTSHPVMCIIQYVTETLIVIRLHYEALPFRERSVERANHSLLLRVYLLSTLY